MVTWETSRLSMVRGMSGLAGMVVRAAGQVKWRGRIAYPGGGCGIRDRVAAELFSACAGLRPGTTSKTLFPNSLRRTSSETGLRYGAVGLDLERVRSGLAVANFLDGGGDDGS